MMSYWLYYGWAVVLFVTNLLAWLSNLINVPGNWLIIICSALFAWLLPAQADMPGVRWTTIAILIALAVAGELIEFLAGAAGAAQQGTSKRSIVMAIAGAVLGSSIGLAAGLPIPLLGSAVAAIIGGACGAFAGAYLGEAWKGRTHQHTMRAARGAFSGRLWGTVGKLAVGAVMLLIVTFDSFL